MRTIPVDSADAREQRENEAARATDSTARPATHRLSEPEHDPRCVAGWLGEDDQDRPIPCPVCRRHLTIRRCSVCGSLSEACRDQRALQRHPCCGHCTHDQEASP